MGGGLGETDGVAQAYSGAKTEPPRSAETVPTMIQTSNQNSMRPDLVRRAVEAGVFVLAALLTVQGAVMAKRSAAGPAMVAMDESMPAPPPTKLILGSFESKPAVVAPLVEQPVVVVEEVATDEPEVVTAPAGYERYFDGRPIRAAKTMTMTVTAYSPDARSCPGTDDGYTATNHSVWTNAMKLVAADTDLLPYGSMVSIPGYADGAVVPVLDCGSAIKGKRLDVLYPTHEIALGWGRQKLKVTIWEYADGKGAKLGR